MFSIYILRLEDNKYYVGKTNNIKKRIKQHKESYGSSWTKKYKFIEMIDVIETNEHFLEDMYVKKYMNRYGINNVRGGSYSRVLLSYEQTVLLQKELDGANNRCFNCGSSKHFVSKCDYVSNIIDTNFNLEFEGSDASDDLEDAIEYVSDLSKRIYNSSIRKTKRFIGYIFN